MLTIDGVRLGNNSYEPCMIPIFFYYEVLHKFRRPQHLRLTVISGMSGQPVLIASACSKSDAHLSGRPESRAIPQAALRVATPEL